MHGSGSRDCTIAVTVSPDRARVVLGGDLDTDAWPELTDALHRLTEAAPGTIDLDVAAVRYVGSVLPNFLVQIRQTVPAASVITVSRPTFWTHFVLRATGIADIARIDEALPG
jgi:anti-anti-sigma regulatory factor